MEWIISMCRDSDLFRMSLRRLMGVQQDGTPQEIAQAFTEWVEERQPKHRRRAA